jgi:transposase
MTKHHIGTPVGFQHDTIFMVFELSGANWLLGIVLPGSSKISRYKVGCGDTAALAELLSKVRTKASQRLAGRPVQLVSAYEAGQEGFWLHRWLEQQGVINHVIDPKSVPVSRERRRAKTDRLDLGLLMRTLLAYRRGEPQVCSMAVPPSPEAEDRRRRTRERERLVKERNAHLNRIRGLLAGQGIYGVNPRRGDFVEQLAGLVTGDGRRLGQNLIEELEREHQRLHLLLKLERELSAQMRADRRQPAAGSPAARVVQLMRLRGLGEVSSEGLYNEVFFRHFDNRRQLGSYLGMTGTPFNSGKKQREQGLSRSGNPRARALAVELAWLWRRHQPDSELTRWYQERLRHSKGGARKALIVALARKLMIALWRYLETGLVPSGAVCRPAARG